MIFFPTHLKMIKRSFLALIVGISILSCGSGAIVSAGISGTGIVFGTITGFGSIIVNGVKYNIDEASFDVDGNLFTGQEGQDNLEIGMVVKLNATTYDDGTGVAISVIYDEAVQGPIFDQPVLSDDTNVKIFSVLGMAISINALTTRFKSEDNVDFGFDNISQGDVVEVSGFVDQLTNSIIATHIEKIGTLEDGNNQVELHGVIEDLALSAENSSFSINGIIIDSSQVMEDHLEDLDTLVNGLFVEVHGEYQLDGTILATEIEGEEGDSEEITSSDGYLSLQGFITSFKSTSEFSVNGVPVFLDTTKVSENVLSQLEEGIQVEVQGFMEEGILQVEEIEIESGS